jgi:pyroglutamyl-peptidase
MTTILLTGFGPFPGAPFNPTGPLIEMLTRRASGGPGNVRHVGHVFATAYDAVDRDLPALLAREKPNVLLMFGLALRARTLRVETLARNALTRTVPDVGGVLPGSDRIVMDAPATLPLAAPAHKLAMAARAVGVPTTVSRDAGRYLCNYLCWRACEAGRQTGGPRLLAFIHVPRVHPADLSRPPLRQPPFTFDDLVRAGEAMVQAAVVAARTRR